MLGMKELQRELLGRMVEAAWPALAAAYRKRWRLAVWAMAADGAVVAGEAPAVAGEAHDLLQVAMQEALRWGEPVIEAAAHGQFYWAVPLTINEAVVGGVISTISEQKLFPRGEGAPAFDVRGAMTHLRELAEQHGLTNAALLARNRETAASERQRAEAIHAFKRGRGSDARAAYLLEEPALLAAIRAGDRNAARAGLNRLLVRLVHTAGPRVELAKSLYLELVVSLTRAAVEAGASAEELLGTNYSMMTGLAALSDDEDIAAWLREALDRVLDAMARRPAVAQDALELRALAIIDEHCTEEISRRDVATALHVSESHLARVLSKRLGQTFPEIITQRRVARAAEWLARTDRPIKLIALQAGFKDQSYFTKVFKKRTGQTPAEYRAARGK